MNEISIQSDVRKFSIFSITSDTSFDYSSLNSEQTPNINEVVRDLVSQQHSRIELTEHKVEINRDIICWSDLKNKINDNEGKTKDNDKSLKEKSIECLKRYSQNISFMTTIVSIFPIINLCKTYSFKLNFIDDIIAGLCLSMVKIPEALANGYLSGLGAAYGLYVEFFPSIIYAIMGSSHHTSIGTFSIVSIMASDVVLRVQDQMYELDDMGNYTLVSEEFTSFEILTSLCLLCGLIQFLMSCLQLGALSLLLSDCITSAFTTAAAVQVMTSYFPAIFDVNLPKMRYTIFRMYREWFEFIENINQTNFISFGISIISLTIVILVQQIVEPLLKKKFKIKIPLPIDLVIVILMTIISWLLKLNEKHGVDIIGNIPKGFPVPKLPRITIFPLLIWDSIVISIVSYTFTVSSAKTFATKYKYKINANQELVAMGTANIFSSFFNCYTCCSSLTRTSLLDRVGAKSQFSHIISIIVLFFVIMFSQPLLYYLPKCILSTIILVALKSMFLQSKHIKRFFKYSRVEGCLWILTFSSVILFDVDIGLLVAVGVQIITIIIRLIKPYNAVMGRLSNTELYINAKHSSQALEIQGIKIFQFSCALIFLNNQTFKEKFYKKMLNISSNEINIYTNDNTRGKSQIRTVIIDCSSIFYIDTSGVETLLEIITDLKNFRIEVLLASCLPPVRTTLLNCNPLLLNTDSMYISVHDAVVKSLSSSEITVV